MGRIIIPEKNTSRTNRTSSTIDIPVVANNPKSNQDGCSFANVEKIIRQLIKDDNNYPTMLNLKFKPSSNNVFTEMRIPIIPLTVKRYLDAQDSSFRGSKEYARAIYFDDLSILEKVLLKLTPKDKAKAKEEYASQLVDYIKRSLIMEYINHGLNDKNLIKNNNKKVEERAYFRHLLPEIDFNVVDLFDPDKDVCFVVRDSDMIKGADQSAICKALKNTLKAHEPHNFKVAYVCGDYFLVSTPELDLKPVVNNSYAESNAQSLYFSLNSMLHLGYFEDYKKAPNPNSDKVKKMSEFLGEQPGR